MISILCIWRLPALKKFYLVFGGVSFVTIFQFVGIKNLPSLDQINILYRLLQKIQTFQQRDRISTWTDMLSSPFRLFGHTYSDFSYLWFSGLQYPHNLLVELYTFYGAVSLPLLFLVTIACFRTFHAIQNGSTIAMVFSIIFLGSLFSADLSDNFAVIALAIIISLNSSGYERKKLL